MYAEFASVYDQLMDDVPYDDWATYYRALLARAGVTGGLLAECGCGTGSMAIPFAKSGFRVIAGDISERMLAIASEKARAAGVRVDWVCQDMRKLALPRAADAVVCCCDGVNYLLGDADARAFFRAAHAALKPGGALAFDISSEEKLRKMAEDGLYGEERDDVAYLWSVRPTENRPILRMDLTFFVRETDGRYRRFEEHQAQRVYQAAALCDLLRACGFADIDVFGDRTFTSPGASEQRIHFLARKAERDCERLPHTEG